MMFRSPSLLKLANGAPCLIQIPGICNGRNVVACHANWSEYGKGVGLKAHDCYIAFGCEACHLAVDNLRMQQLEKEDRRHYWQRGFERTLLWLFENKHLRVVS